jgi:hypothetical protein
MTSYNIIPHFFSFYHNIGSTSDTNRTSPQPSILKYSMTLMNVNGRLTKFSESKGFRKYITAHAISFGVTGNIQRYNRSNVRLIFEGIPEQTEPFLEFLEGCVNQEMMEFNYDYYDEATIQRRMCKTFTILKDHSRHVVTGAYSDDVYETQSVSSSASNEILRSGS